MHKRFIFLVLLMAALFTLVGCHMRTIDQMYCLPKRSESYTNLQSQIDKAMGQAEFHAPISGDNRQSVQMADLDGDGESEYIVFGKSNGENPLQVYFFDGDEGKYHLVERIESTGTAFQHVEYVQLDGLGGMEIVIGRQVSNQVSRSVNVYTLRDGKIQQLLVGNYSKFVCPDLDKDGRGELLLLRDGDSTAQNGIAELYCIRDGQMVKTASAKMSGKVDQIRRIMVSLLQDRANAVFVASSVDEEAIVTDVFSMVDGKFTNVSFSNELGTSVQTLRDHFVFADDIDDDGILELPDLISTHLPDDAQLRQEQFLIRWYAMNSDGTVVDKQFTYHNYTDGWYLVLDSEIAPKMTVVPKGNSYEFYHWNADNTNAQKLMTIHMFTGQKREESAVLNNRFVLHRTDSAVFSGDLEVASGAFGMSRERMIKSFRLIQQDWFTGEI